MSNAVLVFEENQAIQGLIASTISDQVELVQESNPERFVQLAVETQAALMFISNADQRRDYALCKQLQLHPELRHIPRILLVNARDNVQEEQLQALGLQGMIRKPFEAATLQEHIQRHLPSVELSLGPDASDEVNVFDDEMLGLIQDSEEDDLPSAPAAPATASATPPPPPTPAVTAAEDDWSGSAIGEPPLEEEVTEAPVAEPEESAHSDEAVLDMSDATPAPKQVSAPLIEEEEVPDVDFSAEMEGEEPLMSEEPLSNEEPSMAEEPKRAEEPEIEPTQAAPTEDQPAGDEPAGDDEDLQSLDSLLSEEATMEVGPNMMQHDADYLPQAQFKVAELEADVAPEPSVAAPEPEAEPEPEQLATESAESTTAEEPTPAELETEELEAGAVEDEPFADLSDVEEVASWDDVHSMAEYEAAEAEDDFMLIDEDDSFSEDEPLLAAEDEPTVPSIAPAETESPTAEAADDEELDLNMEDGFGADDEELDLNMEDDFGAEETADAPAAAAPSADPADELMLDDDEELDLNMEDDFGAELEADESQVAPALDASVEAEDADDEMSNEVPSTANLVQQGPVDRPVTSSQGVVMTDIGLGLNDFDAPVEEVWTKEPDLDQELRETTSIRLDLNDFEPKLPTTLKAMEAIDGSGPARARFTPNVKEMDYYLITATLEDEEMAQEQEEYDCMLVTEHSSFEHEPDLIDVLEDMDAEAQSALALADDDGDEFHISVDEDFGDFEAPLSAAEAEMDENAEPAALEDDSLEEPADDEEITLSEGFEDDSPFDLEEDEELSVPEPEFEPVPANETAELAPEPAAAKPKRRKFQVFEQDLDSLQTPAPVASEPEPEPTAEADSEPTEGELEAAEAEADAALGELTELGNEMAALEQQEPEMQELSLDDDGLEDELTALEGEEPEILEEETFGNWDDAVDALEEESAPADSDSPEMLEEETFEDWDDAVGALEEESAPVDSSSPEMLEEETFEDWDDAVGALEEESAPADSGSPEMLEEETFEDWDDAVGALEEESEVPAVAATASPSTTETPVQPAAPASIASLETVMESMIARSVQKALSDAMPEIIERIVSELRQPPRS